MTRGGGSRVARAAIDTARTANNALDRYRNASSFGRLVRIQMGWVGKIDGCRVGDGVRGCCIGRRNVTSARGPSVPTSDGNFSGLLCDFGGVGDGPSSLATRRIFEVTTT